VLAVFLIIIYLTSIQSLVLSKQDNFKKYFIYFIFYFNFFEPFLTVVVVSTVEQPN